MLGKFGHNVAVLARVIYLGQSFHFPEHFPHGVLFNQPWIPHLFAKGADKDWVHLSWRTHCATVERDSYKRAAPRSDKDTGSALKSGMFWKCDPNHEIWPAKPVNSGHFGKILNFRKPKSHLHNQIDRPVNFIRIISYWHQRRPYWIRAIFSRAVLTPVFPHPAHSTSSAERLENPADIIDREFFLAATQHLHNLNISVTLDADIKHENCAGSQSWMNPGSDQCEGFWFAHPVCRVPRATIGKFRPPGPASVSYTHLTLPTKRIV